MNQLVGHPRVLYMEHSNYKWGVRKFDLYECGVTTFVTPLLRNLICTLCLWVTKKNIKV